MENTKLKVIDKITDISKQIESYFTEGQVSGADTLLLYGGVKSLAKLMDDLAKKDDIKNIVINEFDKYGEKAVILNNIKFTKRTSVRYDYSEVGHPVIVLHDYINQLLEEYLKNAKEKAKSLANDTSIEPDKIVAINKKTVLALKDNINAAFDDLLDSFEDNLVLTLEINPAVKSSSESIVAQQIK